MKRPARVFLSYAEEDAALRAKLDEHLAGLRLSGHILVWHDQRIRPGEDRASVTNEELEAADIVLLLVSASFLASNDCYEVEVTKALERHRRGEARVIPILVRDCDWTAAPFGYLRALPYEPGVGAKPVTAWSDHDAAWASVAREVRKLIEGDTAAPTAGSTASATPAPKPRPRWIAGAILGGLAAAGLIFLGSRGEPNGPRADVPVSPSVTVTTQASAQPVVSATGSTSPTATAARVILSGKPHAPPSDAGTAPMPTADAAMVTTRGTATFSGQFWSLGVPRSALGGANFVCLDPVTRPEGLAGVQPTCGVLGGSGVAQCSRSDRARNISIGTTVAWRIPCP